MTRRLVLDTNILVSALLFQNGHLAWLRRSWQSRRISPLFCRATTDGLLRVLAYPKFRLDRNDITALLGDLLPYGGCRKSPSPQRRVPQKPLAPAGRGVGVRGEAGKPLFRRRPARACAATEPGRLPIATPSDAATVDQPTPTPEAPRCRDPHDQVFVDLLVATGADALVTGDGDLLAIAAQSVLPILTPAQLRETLSGE